MDRPGVPFKQDVVYRAFVKDTLIAMFGYIMDGARGNKQEDQGCVERVLFPEYSVHREVTNFYSPLATGLE